VAVVPVGLTRFQKNSSRLRSFRADEARDLVQWLTATQDHFIDRFDHPFVFPSDEFYLLADLAVPLEERYAGYPQLENGVGLTRLFLEEWQVVVQELPVSFPKMQVTLVTSVLGAKIISMVVEKLNSLAGLEASMAVIDNHYFGSRITVAGLITGTDLLEQLKSMPLGDMLVLPKVMLKKDEDVFLDGVTLDCLQQQLGKPVVTARGPKDLLRVLLGKRGKEQV
jgi:putative radical SAM enzyme (TIGR03279 family)